MLTLNFNSMTLGLRLWLFAVAAYAAKDKGFNFSRIKGFFPMTRCSLLPLEGIPLFIIKLDELGTCRFQPPICKALKSGLCPNSRLIACGVEFHFATEDPVHNCRIRNDERKTYARYKQQNLQCLHRGR